MIRGQHLKKHSDENIVKTHPTRREFLASSGIWAGRAALAGPIVSATAALIAGCEKPEIPVTEEKHRAVVIGSGFGGAIAAFRLSELGVETVVLERGKRWPITPRGDTFPRFMHPDKRAAWLSLATTFPNAAVGVFTERFIGLVELVKGNGMDAVVGAGVGGSSLIYGGMMVQPTRENFEKVFPPESYSEIRYDELDQVYYPRVRDRIGMAEIPDDVLAAKEYLATRLYLNDAKKADLPVARITDAVDWDVIRDELSGKAVPSATVGESIYGINSGAKNSVDRNYLAWAEKSGHVQIYTQHVVKKITQDPSGSYVVTNDVIDEKGQVVAQKIIQCEKLFVAAGTMGTAQLLVKAKATGDLPELNDWIGKEWGNNGGHLYLRTALPEQTGAYQGAPASVAIRDYKNPLGPVALEFGPAPIEVECRCMPVLGLSIPESRGHFEYDPKAGSVTLQWPKGGNAVAESAIRGTLKKLNDASGGDLLDLEATTGPFTFHPLGGAVLGRALDSYGRVQGYPGMYVVDGSMIPGSAGCANPAFTIAALAERCLDHILKMDFSGKV